MILINVLSVIVYFMNGLAAGVAILVFIREKNNKKRKSLIYLIIWFLLNMSTSIVTLNMMGIL